MGGMEVQINVVSGDITGAQKNPDKYRDLVVRVAGFSAILWSCMWTLK